MINSSENDWKVNVAKYKLDEFKQVRDVYLLLGCLQTTHLIERFFLSQTSEKNELTETNLIILRFLMHTLGSALQKVSKTATTSNKSLLNVFTGLLNKKQIQCWLANDRYTFGHTKNIFDIIKFPPTATEIQSIKTYIKSLAQALNDVLKEYDLTDHLDLITFGEFDFTLYKKQALKGSSFKENILNYISLAEMLLQGSALDNSLTSFLLALTCIEGFGNNLHLVSSLPKNIKSSGEYLVSQRNTIAHANSLSELEKINVREDLNKICNFKEIFTNVKINEIEDENNLSEKELEEPKESLPIINVRKASSLGAAQKMWSLDELTKEAFNNNKKLINIINSNCGTNHNIIQQVPHDDVINALAILASKKKFPDFDFITQHLRRKIDVNKVLNEKTSKSSLEFVKEEIKKKIDISSANKKHAHERIINSTTISGAQHILTMHYFKNSSQPSYGLWIRLIKLGFNLNDYFVAEKNFFTVNLVTENATTEQKYNQIKNLVKLIKYNTASDEINWISIIETLVSDAPTIAAMILANVPEIFTTTFFKDGFNQNINLLTYICEKNLKVENSVNVFLENFISPLMELNSPFEIRKLFLPKKYLSYSNSPIPLDLLNYFSFLYENSKKLNHTSESIKIKKTALLYAFIEEVLPLENIKKYPTALSFLKNPNEFFTCFSKQTIHDYNLLKLCFKSNIHIPPSVTKSFDFKIQENFSLFEIITALYQSELLEATIRIHCLDLVKQIMYAKFTYIYSEPLETFQSKMTCYCARTLLAFNSLLKPEKDEFVILLKRFPIEGFTSPLPLNGEEKNICKILFEKDTIIWNILSFATNFCSTELAKKVTDIFSDKMREKSTI